jgi:hypothetical protein
MALYSMAIRSHDDKRLTCPYLQASQVVRILGVGLNSAPIQRKRQFLPRVTHTSVLCATFANCIR